MIQFFVTVCYCLQCTRFATRMQNITSLVSPSSNLFLSLHLFFSLPPLCICFSFLFSLAFYLLSSRSCSAPICSDHMSYVLSHTSTPPHLRPTSASRRPGHRIALAEQIAHHNDKRPHRSALQRGCPLACPWSQPNIPKHTAVFSFFKFQNIP